MKTGAERERVIIERQVGHLNRLVDDLLDVSRIARGRVELKRQKLEISDVVTRAIEMSARCSNNDRTGSTSKSPEDGMSTVTPPGSVRSSQTF